MRTRPIIHALIAAALLGLPTAALADDTTNHHHDDNRPSTRQSPTPQQQATWQAQHTQQRTQPQQTWQNQHTQQAQTWQNNNNVNRDDQRARDEARAREDQRIREQQRINANNVNNGYYNNGTYNSGYNNGAYQGGYNNGRNGGGQGQLNGVVSSFSNFNLQLNNRQNVQLHQGTVINPTGTTLQPGMQVAIYGHNDGNGIFEADTINVVGGNGQYNNGGIGGLGDILRGIGL